MAEETGGINYEVKVVYDRKILDSLITQVDQVTKSLADFQAATSAASRANLVAAEQLLKRADASKKLAVSKERAAKATTVETEAAKRNTAEFRKLLVLEKRAELAAQNAFRLQRRRISADAARFKAIEKVVAVENKRRISEASLQEIQRKGLDLSAQELRAAGVLDKAVLELAAAKDKLAAQERRVGPREVIRLEAEARALKEKNALLAEAQLLQARAALGLDPTGKTTIADAQRKKQEAAARAQSEANFRQFKKENAQRISLAQERLALEKQIGDTALLKMRAQVGILREQLALRQKAADVAARTAAGIAPPGSPGGPGGRGRGGRPADDNEKFNKSLKNTQSLANRISFTFRRLFGILAAFTIARRLVQAFNDSVRSAIQFNARLEQAQLGIASIIVATGSITTATGQAAESAQGLTIALGESRRQTELLKVEALKTSSTFEQLIENFQTAIAPGFQAGLDIDEIRRFTVRISQAAQAIGLPQQQLAEEIRSLLQGTIRVRDTRIAIALGITNDDIRRAKELGALGQFLEKRFEAFAEAGKLAEKTFAVAFSNLIDALKLLAGEAGSEFFNTFKETILSISNSIRSFSDITGEIEFNPELLEFAQVFFDVLKNSVDQLVLLGQGLNLEQFTNIGTTVSSAANLAFTAIRVAVTLLIEGLSTASGILTAIFSTFTDIADFVIRLDGSLGGIISDTTRWLIALKAIQIAVRLLLVSLAKTAVLLTGQILGGFLNIVRASRQLGTLIVFGTITQRLQAASIAAAALAGKILIAVGAGVALGAAIDAARVAIDAYIESLDKDFLRDRLEALEAINEAFERQKEIGLEAQQVAPLSGALAGEIIDSETIGEEIDRVKFKIATLEDPIQAFKDRFQRDINLVIEGLSDSVQAVSDRLSTSVESTTGSVDSLTAAFQENLGAITQGTQGLQAQNEIIRELEVAAKQVKASLELTAQSLNTSNTVFNQRLGLIEAQLKAEEDSRQATAQRTQQEIALNNVFLKRLQLQTQVATLTDVEQNAVTVLRSRLTAIEAARQRLLDLKKEEDLLELQISQAERFRRIEELTELQKRLDLIRDQISGQQVGISRIEESSREKILELLDGQTDNLDEIINLAKGIVIASAEEEGVKRNLRDIDAERNRLASAHARIAERNVRIAALEETNLAVQRNKELEVQIQNERRLFRARQAFTVQPGQESLALAKNAVEEEEERLRVLKLRGAEELKSLQILQEESTALSTILAVGSQRIAREKEITAELTLQQEKIRAARQELDLAQLQQDRPIFAGFLTAIQEFSTQGLDLFRQTVDLMTNIFRGFTDFASASIVSIFDPTNTQTAKERLGRFLLQIAQQIIAMIIQVAIIQRTLLPWLNALGASSNEAGPGTIDRYDPDFFNTGGEVTKGGGKWTKAHIGAPGFNLGGPPNSKDTVPIWAQAGEHIIRRSSARKYGAHVMESINRGLIDPFALKALAGARRISAALASPTRPALQSGGLISDRLRALEAAGPPQDAQATGLPGMGFVVASEDAMEGLIAGGRNALMSFFEANAPQIRTVLEP